jgi:hypothetical protein
VLFERLAILVLKEMSVEGGGKVLRISWDEAWQIMGRSMERGGGRDVKRHIVLRGKPAHTFTSSMPSISIILKAIFP